jgi:hypothetical protein
MQRENTTASKSGWKVRFRLNLFGKLLSELLQNGHQD